MAFGKSFDEAFNKTAPVVASGQMDLIKEKIKEDRVKANDQAKVAANIEAASSVAESLAKQTGDQSIVDNIHAMMYSSTPDGKVKAIPQTEQSSKAILTMVTQGATMVQKMKQMEVLKQNRPDEGVYIQGNEGAPRLTGMVPSGSKVFKEALTPEQMGNRTTATETAKYEGVKENAKRAFDLRTEFQALPQVKEFQTIKAQVSSMDALLKNVKTGDKQSALALDQGVITLFNKVTDPASVVRESEYERTPANLSLVNRFQGAYEKLTKGGAGLTQADREALVFGAKVIADSRGKGYNEILSNYEGLSKEFGVKPELVTGGYGKSEGFLNNTKDQYEYKTVNGVKMRKKISGK